MIKVYENEELFDEIMKHHQVDMNISSWDYSSDNYFPLYDRKTGHRVGWLVFREWGDKNETYISIKEEVFE